MRVLMLNNEFPPLGGGTGTVNQAVLERFAGIEGLAVDLITSAAGLRRAEEWFSERIRITRVPVGSRDVHHASNRELLTYAARALPLAVARHRARPYHACFAWSAVPAGALALTLRRFYGLPYLVRVCGPDIPGFEQRYRLISRLLCPLIRAVWRSAETVVAKCDGEAAMIRHVDNSADISIVPNGVDTSIFRPGDPIPDDGPLRLLCVARLIRRKGQHHLIEAVRRLAKEGIAVTLEFVGTGDARKGYQEQVKQLRLDDRIRFAGYVPREAMPERYAAAHVFVLPSYNEGMSVATLEAMAAGLPVVVTRTGGTTDLVKEGVNGLTFDWADVDGLTDHLRCIASDRGLTRSMGAASRVHAKAFSWDQTATCYLHMLDQAADYVGNSGGQPSSPAIPGPQ